MQLQLYHRFPKKHANSFNNVGAELNSAKFEHILVHPSILFGQTYSNRKYIFMLNSQYLSHHRTLASQAHPYSMTQSHPFLNSISKFNLCMETPRLNHQYTPLSVWYLLTSLLKPAQEFNNLLTLIHPQRQCHSLRLDASYAHHQILWFRYQEHMARPRLPS